VLAFLVKERSNIEMEHTTLPLDTVSQIGLAVGLNGTHTLSDSS